MGITFRGLTSSALVNRNESSAAAAEKDVADVPASYAAHTSTDGGRPDEKLGAPRTNGVESDSDEELNKIDTHAEQGVQAIQAMTHVWSKRGLLMGFIW